MRRRAFALLPMLMLPLASLACTSLGRGTQTPSPSPTPAPPTHTPPPTSLPAVEGSAEQPVLIRGKIPFTSPFFINTVAEPFVLLEDEAGFVKRDRLFEFPRHGQVIGPVEFIDDSTLSYTLLLPAVPQGTLVDVDQDGQEDQGVMIFAVAYWSNIWGDPFLEARDGTGWSTAYTSAFTDPDNEDEIKGGTLIIWAPDDQQGFPSGFGPDGLLFSADDPVTPVPAGYSLVDLDQEPFRIYQEREPVIDLLEGEIALNDLSAMSYAEAFEALFEKASREYPFTAEKGIDWEALYEEYAGPIKEARDDVAFYRALKAFLQAIPDGHVGLSFNRRVFQESIGGGIGLVVTELSDGRVIATQVIEGLPAAEAGIQPGAEILRWNDLPPGQAIAQVQPFFGPYSTEHHRRVEQARLLTRMPAGERVSLAYRNPVGPQRTATLIAVPEVDSIIATIPILNIDPLELPVFARTLPEGPAYIRITTFSDDYNMLARLWERYLETIVEEDPPGLILDIRINGGGNGALARDFAGFFFDEEFILSQRLYFNQRSGEFEPRGLPSRVLPAPTLYEGPLAVLIGPDCASACEGFAYALTHAGRAITVGHYPTAGMFGEVGRGQYKLPGDISLQFPTGRPETPEGQLLIEGSGVVPDIQVPVTQESALGKVDAVLQAAIEALVGGSP